MLGGRAEHHEALAASRVHRPPGEVRLPAARRVVLTVDGLRGALAHEVDRDGRVDRDEAVLLRDHARVVHVANRPQLERAVLVQEVVETPRPERERAHGLRAVELLGHSVDHPALDEVHQAVGDELGVHAEIPVIDERGHHGVGDGADARLDRRPVRDALGHEGRDPVVDVGAVGRRHLDERAVDLDPTDHLAHVDLVATERPRHLGVRLQEEPGPTDERRHVVGIQAQAEVAVAIGRGCRRQHERIGRAVRQDGPHLAEVVGDEIEGAGLERRSGHVRQEVGDVVQPARIRAVQIGPIVQRVHLVHDDVRS